MSLRKNIFKTAVKDYKATLINLKKYDTLVPNLKKKTIR